MIKKCDRKWNGKNESAKIGNQRDIYKCDDKKLDRKWSGKNKSTKNKEVKGYINIYVMIKNATESGEGRIKVQKIGK